MTTNQLLHFGRAVILGVTVVASSAVVAQAPAVSLSSPIEKAAPRTQLVDAIAAVVNNEVITYRELDDRIQRVVQRAQTRGETLPPPAQLQRQLLERLIIDRVQMQRAKEIGIVVDDLTLDRAIARIAEQNQMTLPQFHAQLKSEGTSLAAFREEIRAEITLQRLREREVNNKIQIAESEVDNLVQDGRAGNGQAGPTELSLNLILINIPDNATPDQVAQRRQRAEEALQQLKAGTAFTKVAATYSDASDGVQGGATGWRAEDRLPQLFLDAVKGLKAGEVSPIVKSANGFHILQLLGRRVAGAADATAAVPAVQQTRARHILIKVNKVVTPEEARRRLVELKERLDFKAATFEELAKLYSNDFSAAKGGDLGWIYPGDTVPEFERAMNALQPGEVSDPIESPFGYHLIEVLERKTDDVSQERQRMVARQALRERKQEERTEEWLRQLRDRAYVEYRPLDSGLN